MNYTYQQLVDATTGGGAPSGWSRSTYTSICRALQAYETATNKQAVENYLSPTAIARFDALKLLVHEFLVVRHPNPSAERGKKSREVDAVGELREAIEATEPRRNLCDLLHRFSTLGAHAHGGNADVIRNSMQGWIGLLSSGAVSLVLTDQGSINGELNNGNRLIIHTTNFFARALKFIQRDEYVPVSILVHEYHHYLVRRAGAPTSQVYYDEFVAHWKQYDAAGIIDTIGRAQCIRDLNEWLLRASAGYKRLHEITSGSAQELQDPSDAPDVFWRDRMDNAR